MFGFLNAHSHHSLLNGIAKIPALIERAKEEGCDALALTDSSNLYGAIDFYTRATDAGVKPIIGTTLYVRHAGSQVRYPLVLLAKNSDGYQNLMLLITLANFSEENHPTLSIDQVQSSCEGVIAIIPPLYSRVQQDLVRGNRDRAAERLREYQDVFGTQLYVGISPQQATVKRGSPAPEVTEDLVACADAAGVPVIPLPLIYLLDEEDVEAREVALRIQRSPLTDIEKDVFEDPLLFPKRQDIESWCSSVCPQALDHLSDLISSISLDLDLGKWVFPKPPTDDTRDSKELLREYVEQGYQRRNLEKTGEVADRVDFELDVINGRGYADYFLTVIDLISFMHSNDILTSTRGSAAGSMVSYLAGITNVDPIKYQLPFERFLNPYRPSPPDIDIDIADNRRSDVINYIVQRFGEEKVAQIGTQGTMMARAAVRDTARALGYSYMTGDRIARLIPIGKQGAPMYIDTALEEVPDLASLYKSEEDVKHIIDVAKKIEGNARHVSVHAAGVVISPTTAVKYTPLERDPSGATGRSITQYDMHAVEDAGLLKFDILGLTNLSILSESIKLTERDMGVAIDVENLPVDDQKTYKMIGDGYTTGVFQLGGSGMTAVLKRMKPTTIHDFAAIIALYRPGPMDNINEYIDRKQGRKSASYIHEDMKKFLQESHGVLVYQDDLLYTAIELAGYNWEEVDVFRKAVGKKIPELMAQQEKIFKKRVAERTNLPKDRIEKLWNLFEPFKGYGFNKAHALSYAKLAYQTAYMKAHYPAQYLTAHLNAEIGDVEKIAELVYEAKQFQLHMFPPGINESDMTFTTEKGSEHEREGIRIGLGTIKQVGERVAESIVEERKRNGSYASVQDFFVRMAPYRVLQRRNVEALIKVGVFESFERRDTLLENIATLLQCTKDAGTEASQSTLFDTSETISISLQPAREKIQKTQELYWEKDLLGIYVSGHPLTFFKREGLPIREIKQRKEKDKKLLTTAVISDIKPFRNKSGERMYFVTLEDDVNNKIEAVCFPNTASTYEEMLALHRPIKIRGVTSERNQEIGLKIDSLEDPAPLGV
ncbi:MAG: DNA polymerase III subunit alpha [Candidatus Kaiserbacteria bacterium]|nr:DNA polymerase III subunit alpha [Candidatus Kaiserbacteria bacterium]